MKIKKFKFLVAAFIMISTIIHAQSDRVILSDSALEYSHSKFIFNGSIGIGTFSAGENLGGSAFSGVSLSTDWIPNRKTGLSYGLESGLLGGASQGDIIYGIPAIFRFGWHPSFIKNKNIDVFILLKTGWAFGIWNDQLEKDANPNGAVGGINLGGRYFLSPLVGIYAELGYNYYGLARSSNHPGYPLGYGSGKLYASMGLSIKMYKEKNITMKKNHKLNSLTSSKFQFK